MKTGVATIVISAILLITQYSLVLVAANVDFEAVHNGSTADEKQHVVSYQQDRTDEDLVHAESVPEQGNVGQDDEVDRPSEGVNHTHQQEEATTTIVEDSEPHDITSDSEEPVAVDESAPIEEDDSLFRSDEYSVPTNHQHGVQEAESDDGNVRIADQEQKNNEDDKVENDSAFDERILEAEKKAEEQLMREGEEPQESMAEDKNQAELLDDEITDTQECADTDNSAENTESSGSDAGQVPASDNIELSLDEQQGESTPELPNEESRTEEDQMQKHMHSSDVEIEQTKLESVSEETHHIPNEESVDTPKKEEANNNDHLANQGDENGTDGNFNDDGASFEALRQAQILQRDHQQPVDESDESAVGYRGTWGKQRFGERPPDMDLLYKVFEDRIRKKLGIDPLPESMLREHIFPLGVGYSEDEADSTEGLSSAEDLELTREKSSSTDVNSDFVEGLDDIDKFFEGVDPPDELDVGASGSSMQDMLMNKGKEILVKRFRMGLALIRLAFHSAKAKVLAKWIELRSGKIDFKGFADRMWKQFQHAYEKVTDFVDNILEGSKDDEEEDFETFKKMTMEDYEQQL